ncbi:leucyl/phenylalanyl-tRNA--protein transferase [Micromonospora sp. NPDC049559]|uniref:leucyl/phenylalanyl-tRNA--protein transferase n=1 Tax=Micromonospora sp. NPDC049559 TaxID=3155923 RepID=UPI0034210ED2
MTDWEEITLHPASADQPVAFGGQLDSSSLLSAAQAGLFAMPAAPIQRHILRLLHENDLLAGTIAGLGGTADPFSLSWWCPDPRFVIPAGEARTRKKQRAMIRRGRWVSTVNTAFRQVAEACRAGREPRWLTDDFLDALLGLHRDGWAYSLEIWDDGELVGGAFGLAFGSTLSVDSHFQARPEASKIAMVDIALRAQTCGVDVIDLQWPSRHGADVGGRVMARQEFVGLVRGQNRLKVSLPEEQRPLQWLLEQPLRR